MKKLLTVSLFSLAVLMTTPAQAGSLTEAKVKDFYGKMENLLSKKTPDTQAIISFFKTHFADDGKFVVHMKGNLPGTTLDHEKSKQQVIESYQKAGAVTVIDNEIEIKKVRIDPNGKEAMVMYHNWNAAEMTQGPKGKRMKIAFKGVSSCVDQVTIGANGKLSVTMSECNATIEYEQPKPVK